MQGATPAGSPDIARRRQVVEAFLAASRHGDLAGLVAVLHPDVVFRPDPASAAVGGVGELRGAAAVAAMFEGKAKGARVAVVDGDVGAVVGPPGRLVVALRFEIADGRVVAIDAVADPAQLATLDVEGG